MQKKIRTLLVDDEPLALRGLQIRLKEFEDVEIIGTCSNGREAIKKIRAERPALVFLDIQMPGFDGFAVIKALAKEEIPLIVFATAFDQYAIKAFESHAQDYLLKPIDTDRLHETMNRVREAIKERITVEQNAKLIELIRSMDNPPTLELSEIINTQELVNENNYETHLNIKDRGQITRVDITTIEWIDAAGDYMCLHADGKTHILRETMKNMEKRLDPEIFQRVHRSTIININKVKELQPTTGGKYQITLESGADLQVSRNYRDVLGRFL
ncbi:DNA-binding response regulator [Paremcibacter congregatus]|uniref:DNA-binding response regulator n=2 Tax=Paremcibacter congregatus TaxID=2043170 RepID=A0A2G4YNL4_9PROT|nr:DNA-binding response regulator [Paremcibacter congregatus]QDE29224.1 response regulator transcription factor [Paremcibacter congregatus]